MRDKILKNGLVVGIIFLFLGVGFQPAIANMLSIVETNYKGEINRELYNKNSRGAIENFDCILWAKATNIAFFSSSDGKYIFTLLPIKIFTKPVDVTFGTVQGWDKPYPSNGWISTRGENGHLYLESDTIWGQLGWHLHGILEIYPFYIGAKNFKGIMIEFKLFQDPVVTTIYGFASHVHVATAGHP